MTVPPPQPEVFEAEIVPEPPPAPAPSPWDIQFLDNPRDPVEVRNFLEPPADAATPGPAPSPVPRTPPLRRMFETLLDPRSIQWLLILGGGLMVLGGLIWLISKGVLESPVVLATIFGAATLGMVLAGWWVTLKTRYKTAGRALTFLGCVAAPLNLWFYHAQDLVVIDQGLWVGGLACVLLYVATVRVLRDPMFLYAVEAGLTLTAVLLLADFGVAGRAAHLTILLMALGMASIHAHRVFLTDAEHFTRDRYGLPLFWSGHFQLAAALIILLAAQAAWWMREPLSSILPMSGEGEFLGASPWLCGLLWLAGAYAYLYSDLAVRRVGYYTYAAAVCLLLAEISIAGLGWLGLDGVIVALSLTALTVSVAARLVPPAHQSLARAVAPLAFVLSFVPVALGLLAHLRATSIVLAELEWSRPTGWSFVAVMLTVAVVNRVSAYLYENASPRLAAAYFCFCGAAVTVAAAGLLRMLGVEGLSGQAPLLMFIPIGYMVAARLWRGRYPERPLGWVAHAASAVILAHVAAGAAISAARGFEESLHLVLAVILVQAAVFYTLAALFRRRAVNQYLAAAAACGAAWQLMLYADISQAWFSLFFALVGLGMLAAARLLGFEETPIFRRDQQVGAAVRGRGAKMVNGGHAVLAIAVTAAFLQGLLQLAAQLDVSDPAKLNWPTLAVMTLVNLIAIGLSPQGAWRRFYAATTLAMAGLTMLTLNVAIDLSGWRKVEILLVTVGLISVAAGYVGRFRETDAGKQNDTVSLALWWGSLLAALPLIAAVFYHWGASHEYSLVDELVLISVTLLMLVTGVVWQVRSTTLIGGGTLAVYLSALIVSLVYRPQVAVGFYLAAAGAVLFSVALLLSIYRERLAALPDRIANREGVFRIIGWR